MVVRLQPPPCHLISYNDRRLCFGKAVITPSRAEAAAAPMARSNVAGPTEALVFPVAAQKHLVTQSRSTGTSTPNRLYPGGVLQDVIVSHGNSKDVPHDQVTSQAAYEAIASSAMNHLLFVSLLFCVNSFSPFWLPWDRTHHKTLACKLCLSLCSQASASPWKYGGHFLNPVITFSITSSRKTQHVNLFTRCL